MPRLVSYKDFDEAFICSPQKALRVLPWRGSTTSKLARKATFSYRGICWPPAGVRLPTTLVSKAVLMNG
jgi:hypothetical protein